MTLCMQAVESDSFAPTIAIASQWLADCMHDLVASQGSGMHARWQVHVSMLMAYRMVLRMLDRSSALFVASSAKHMLWYVFSTCSRQGRAAPGYVASKRSKSPAQLQGSVNVLQGQLELLPHAVLLKT